MPRQPEPPSAESGSSRCDWRTACAIDGFYDHNSYEAAAIDVSLFILIIGGFLD